jgi:hypothetical protein
MIKGFPLFNSFSFKDMGQVMQSGTGGRLLLGGKEFGGAARITKPHMM